MAQGSDQSVRRRLLDTFLFLGFLPTVKLTRCPRTGAPRVLSTIRADVKNVFVPIIVGDNPKPRSDLKCLIVPIVIVVFQLCSVSKMAGAWLQARESQLCMERFADLRSW
jgi:hypothetical protein